jgi:Ca2+-transporting ATPase
MLRTITLCYRDFESWPPPVTSFRSSDEVDYEDLSHDMTLVAITGIEDPFCPSVHEAITTCHCTGVTIKMCTGDNILTAGLIATQCGIYTAGGIITKGPVFCTLDDAERMEVVSCLQVLAQSSPEDKKVLVGTLHKFSEIFSVTSDGTNDGPVLKSTNVGFSMGIAGTEVAKEASGIIFMDDNFASIVKLPCGVSVSVMQSISSCSSRSQPTSLLSSHLYLLSLQMRRHLLYPLFNCSGSTSSLSLSPLLPSPLILPWNLY